jgi:hypothetical protein
METKKHYLERYGDVRVAHKQLIRTIWDLKRLPKSGSIQALIDMLERGSDLLYDLECELIEHHLSEHLPE